MRKSTKNKLENCIVANKIIAKNKAELSIAGKKLFFTVAEPANIQVVTWSTTPLHDYDASNPGTVFVGFLLQLPAHSKQAVSVLLEPSKAVKENRRKIDSLDKWPKE